MRLYYQTVEGHARLVAQLREIARGRDHVLFEQLKKRSGELRLDVKHEKDNLFSTARNMDVSKRTVGYLPQFSNPPQPPFTPA